MIENKWRKPKLSQKLLRLLIFGGGKREKALWNLHTFVAKDPQCIVYRDGEKYSFEGFSSGEFYYLETDQFVYLEGDRMTPSRSTGVLVADIVELLENCGFKRIIERNTNTSQP